MDFSVIVNYFKTTVPALTNLCNLLYINSFLVFGSDGLQSCFVGTSFRCARVASRGAALPLPLGCNHRDFVWHLTLILTLSYGSFLCEINFPDTLNHAVVEEILLTL